MTVSVAFNQVPLKRLARISSSNVDKVIEANEEPVRLCNYVDVYYNERIHSRMEFPAGSATQSEIKRFRLRPGDVLITKDSETPDDIAVPALVTDAPDDLVCGYHLALLRAKRSRLESTFLYYALCSLPSRAGFAVRAQGITRYGLTLGAIGSIPIPLPDRRTQREIADFLGRETARIDQLIEKKQIFIEVLGQRREATTRQLLSGESSRTEARRATHMPWLRSVPAHWQVVPLRYLVRISTGGRDTQDRSDEGAYPFYVRSMKIERIDTYSYDEEAVLTSGDGAGVGKVFHHVNGKFELHQRMYAFTRFKGLSGRYFYHFLRTFFHLQMTQWSAKSTVDSVRMPFMKSMLIAVPLREEQEALLREIDTSHTKASMIADATERSIERLREFRTALITAAVTGQMDVATWGKRGQTDRRLDRIEEEMTA